MMGVFLVASSLVLSLPEKVDEHRPKLVIFFQEDCLACAKQFEEFSCFEKKKGYSIEVIGVGEDKLALKKHARRLSKGDKEAKSFINWQKAKSLGLAGTPTTLVLEKNGQEKLLQGLYLCEA